MEWLVLPKMLLICHFILYEYGICSWCGIYHDQCCFNNGIRAIIIIYRAVRKWKKEHQQKTKKNKSYAAVDVKHGDMRFQEGEGHMCMFILYIFISSTSASCCFLPSWPPAREWSVRLSSISFYGRQDQWQWSGLSEGESINLEFWWCRGYGPTFFFGSFPLIRFYLYLLSPSSSVHFSTSTIPILASQPTLLCFVTSIRPLGCGFLCLPMAPFALPLQMELIQCWPNRWSLHWPIEMEAM